MIEQIKIGDAKIGEMVMWDHAIAGEVYADVIEQTEAFAIVIDDQNNKYFWSRQMMVTVAR